VTPAPTTPSTSPHTRVPVRRAIRILVWARRVSQTVFLLSFLMLLAQTTFRGRFGAGANELIRLKWPVEFFLSLDPYLALITALSSHTIYRGLFWSLIVVVLTVALGRVFCGWICPFGTLHHLIGWFFPSRANRGSRRIEANRTHGWQVTKYYLLFAFLGASLFGSVIGGMFDPICVAIRSIGLGVLPALQYLGIRGGDMVTAGGGRFAQNTTDGALDFLAANVWTTNQAYTHHAWLIVTLIVAILFMNRIVPRFWCRALCPLGAMLGLLSRFTLLGMRKTHEKCTDCNLCLAHCQGADSPEGGKKHRRDECHLCLNCEAACPEGVIAWSWMPNLRSSQNSPRLDRRRALVSAAAGAAAIPALRIGNWPDRAYSEKVIRPPGSVEEREFLERCIRCGQCMKVCPNNALHPALFEAGVEGMWTPILIPRIGYCEHSCVLCGQVCPTGAIARITEKAKLGTGQPAVRVGTAMYDQGRCLPWAMATPCIVCEEFCPTSPKAIWVEKVTIPRRSQAPALDGSEPPMQEVTVQRPHIDPSLCIGCGACENVCPVVDKPAVYVTSAGESRSKTNVILLQGRG
jgi:polyferredoxin